jgi:hypothetical protein
VRAKKKVAAKKTRASVAVKKVAKKKAAKPAARPTPAKRATKVAKTPAKPSQGRTVAGKSATPSARRKSVAKPRPITPEQALENTRNLLEAKQEHDRQTPAWQQLDGGHAPETQGGYQSEEAAARAAELHAAESRLQATQGSIGTQGRHDQGKRDNR